MVESLECHQSHLMFSVPFSLHLFYHFLHFCASLFCLTLHYVDWCGSVSGHNQFSLPEELLDPLCSQLGSTSVEIFLLHSSPVVLLLVWRGTGNCGLSCSHAPPSFPPPFSAEDWIIHFCVGSTFIYKSQSFKLHCEASQTLVMIFPSCFRKLLLKLNWQRRWVIARLQPQVTDLADGSTHTLLSFSIYILALSV